MDPNTTLKEMLDIAYLLTGKTRNWGMMSEECRGNYGEELSELCLALDEWITKGGFLPERWAKKV